MNTTTQTVLKYTVIGGSVIMVAGAIGQIATTVSSKQITAGAIIMPAISILVGVSAFSYAVSGEEIRVIPKA